MSDARLGVAHDAASLHRFIDSICSFCPADRKHPSYLPASRTFLDYVRELGTATNNYLQLFPAKFPVNTSDYPIYRQELWALRSAWFEIHRRVKPAADADTLRLPAALIAALVARLRTVPQFAQTDFAVIHIERLNYLQVIASGIRDTTARIASLVGGPTFPNHLGLIGIPYSQSESLFVNCLIAHEMGHFVFGELQLRNVFATMISAALNKAFAPQPSAVGSREKYWLPTIVADWLEEIFCDLFAIRFIGPCYALAFVEIFDLPNTLTLDASVNPIAAAADCEFSDSHPANMYRISLQLQLLKSLAWWDELKGSRSHHIRVLEVSEGLSRTSLKFPSFDPVATYVFAALDELIPEVQKSVMDVLTPLDPGVNEYRRLRSEVQTLLHHGIVPSTVVSPTGERIAPNAITVINAAFQLQLDTLEDLISRIEGQDAASVGHRAEWTRRVEMWTLKALDDLARIAKES